MWGITRYQWTVLFAAWLGWGFDVFDGLLFNYVAPNCIPALLHFLEAYQSQILIPFELPAIQRAFRHARGE